MNMIFITLGKSSCIISVHVLVLFLFPPYHRAFIKGLCDQTEFTQAATFFTNTFSFPGKSDFTKQAYVEGVP